MFCFVLSFFLYPPFDLSTSIAAIFLLPLSISCIYPGTQPSSIHPPINHHPPPPQPPLLPSFLPPPLKRHPEKRQEARCNHHITSTYSPSLQILLRQLPRAPPPTPPLPDHHQSSSLNVAQAAFSDLLFSSFVSFTHQLGILPTATLLTLHTYPSLYTDVIALPSTTPLTSPPRTTKLDWTLSAPSQWWSRCCNSTPLLSMPNVDLSCRVYVCWAGSSDTEAWHACMHPSSEEFGRRPGGDGDTRDIWCWHFSSWMFFAWCCPCGVFLGFGTSRSFDVVVLRSFTIPRIQ